MGELRLWLNNGFKWKACRILTVLSKFAPASGPAESGVVELAGATCQADWSDVVSESDGAAELHYSNVIVEQSVVVVRMDDDIGHSAGLLMDVGASLSLSSKVEGICTRGFSG